MRYKKMEAFTKKVLKEVEFYRAFDGKEFERDDECIDYEMTLKMQSIEAYDEDFERMEFEGAKYVVVHSEEEIDLIEEICDYNGWIYEGIDSVGLFRYNGERYWDRWEKVKIPHFLMPFVKLI
jgi:hypothetical protein